MDADRSLAEPMFHRQSQRQTKEAANAPWQWKDHRPTLPPVVFAHGIDESRVISVVAK